MCGSISPGVTVPPRGVDPGEAAERVALGLERGLEGRARADGDDPALPARDDRRIGRARSTGLGRTRRADLALRRTRRERRRPS